MTREDIEKLNVVEPYCFESDREELWYNIGLKEGLEIADNNPKYPWISVKDKLPPEEKDGLSIKVLVLSTKNEVNFSRYDYAVGGWISPVLDIEFTHWMPLPEPPKE